MLNSRCSGDVRLMESEPNKKDKILKSSRLSPEERSRWISRKRIWDRNGKNIKARGLCVNHSL